MKKTYFFAALIAVLFAACSSDNFMESSDDGNSPIESKSAADKIFTLTLLDVPYAKSYYSRNYICVDTIGNLYSFVDNLEGENSLTGKVL